MDLCFSWRTWRLGGFFATSALRCRTNSPFVKFGKADTAVPNFANGLISHTAETAVAREAAFVDRQPEG